MKRFRVLVIDDDPAHLNATLDLLADVGYEVAGHPRALGATERFLATDPDLVLLDVNMPALSGDALVPLLRGRARRPCRFLLHSSNDEALLRAAAARHGADGFVGKGDVAALLRVVRREAARAEAAAVLAAGR